ncbi:MAG: hypothetical protein HKO59_17615 [Phycisphaerales bacterium]|nr:hypothetical protein [Phycisphaerae bacterium]NNF44756.1 hypothetical protein [Phycisphaerales bacterium]NNM27761.1 hypothetical protein [Phycisphaerales bacterium]
MKSFWNLVSFLAVVNMLALIGFGGWLWQSGRLDRGRLLAIKELLAPTLAEAEVRAEADAEAMRQAEAETLRGWEATNPPMASETQLRSIALVQNQETQAARRLADQSEQLFAQLEERARVLKEQEEAFASRQAAWEDARAEAQNQRVQEQFQKTVKLYESIPSKQAKQLLTTLVDGGGMDQAVAYVNAMNTRAAAKVIRELKSDEESKLATELLEMIRTYDPMVSAPETASDANAPDTNAQPAASGT